MAAKKPIQKVIGDNLRRVRLDRGISQEKLAHRAGLHRTFVSSVERGEVNISVRNVARLARALGVRFADLGVEDTPPPVSPKRLATPKRSEGGSTGGTPRKGHKN